MHLHCQLSSGSENQHAGGAALGLLVAATILLVHGRQSGHSKGQSLATARFGNANNISALAIVATVQKDRPALGLDRAGLDELIDLRALLEKDGVDLGHAARGIKGGIRVVGLVGIDDLGGGLAILVVVRVHEDDLLLLSPLTNVAAVES